MAEVPKIYQQLALVRAEIPTMSKDGRNSAQNYNFLSEAQVTELMKELLAKHRIWFETSFVVVGVEPTPKGTQNLTTVKVNYKFTSLEDGSSIGGVAYGQGTDANDKGIYKAVTGAVKYVFMKNFLIVTGDDPENNTQVTSSGADVPFGDED